MDRKELQSHVDTLLKEGNYIGAYGHVRTLPEADSLRVDLTGRIANAILEELSSLRGQSSERNAFLRAQLAWVCRDVPGLSYLYREQTRARQEPAFDIFKSIQDIASGRPEDAADRVKRSVEDVRESIASGQATEKLQDVFKEVERNMKEGAKQVGSFFDNMVRRGEEIRRQSEADIQAGSQEVRPEGADKKTSAEPEIKISIEKEDGDKE